MRKRQYYAIFTFILFAAELLIAKYASGFVRGSVGDILAAVLVFCAVRTAAPDFARGLLPVYVFLFSCFVELLQLFRFVELIGVQDSYILSTAIGGTFSFYDLLCYAMGSLSCYVIQYMIDRTS